MSSAVAAIIAREIELVSQFVSVLNDEQEALTRADVAALPELMTRKSPLVEQLNAIESERLGALDMPTTTTERGAMENWLAQNGNDAVAAVNWKKLLNVAAEAKTLHELNSQLVDMHLRQATETLAILTAQPEQSALYGSSGQAVPTTGSRIVDSA